MNRLVASLPSTSLLYAAAGCGGASSPAQTLVVGLPSAAINEVGEIGLLSVASLLPAVSLPTVITETLLAVSLLSVATNEVEEISLPLLQLTLYNVQAHIWCTHTYTRFGSLYFPFLQVRQSFTHPPSLLPASFGNAFVIKKPLNFQDTKRHLANKINWRPFCRSYLKRLFAPSCPWDSTVNLF